MMRFTPILLACIVGLLSIAPYFFAYEVVTAPTQSKLHYFYQDSELVYLFRIREVLEGNISITSPVFHEYKMGQSVQQPFGEWLYALGSLGNVEYLYAFVLLSKFLFPALLFYLVYRLVFLLIGETHASLKTHSWFALFVASLITLGFDLTNGGFVRQVLAFHFDVTPLSIWTRLVNPITGALGLFVTSYLILTTHKKHTELRIILAGSILGCMSGYIFSFAIGVVGYTLLMVLWLFSRMYVRARQLFFVLTIAFVINLPYFWSLISMQNDTTTLTKNGLLLTHNILHNQTLYITIGVFFISTLLYRMLVPSWREQLRSPLWQWSAAMLAASLVSLNEQVLTGKTVWPGHFVQYTIPLCYIIVLSTVYSLANALHDKWSSRIQGWYQRTVLVGSVLGILVLLLINILALFPARTENAAYTYDQRYAPALTWLNIHAGTPCVVFVLEQDERMEKFIPAYTGCDLYISTYTFYDVPEERILHNYIVKMRLLGVTPESAREYLNIHARDLNRYFFEDWVDLFPEAGNEWVKRTKSRVATEAFIPMTTDRIDTVYQALSAIPTNVLLTQYAVDYVIIDTNRDSAVVLEALYPLVYESEGIKIFAVRSEMHIGKSEDHSHITFKP